MTRNQSLIGYFTFLVAFISICTAFDRVKTKAKGITFRTANTRILNDTTIKIDIVIDNAEREREFTIYGYSKPDSFVLQGIFPAYFYNYSKTFTATIPIK